ncbi:amino acid ABC transporter permease [Kitasatospora sp. NPDC006697]|uniref:amino acid ABC transporter permease n=1 Tax=Kitasatospora sp. NPDC006697 TaxID=3364020 RepID=UPI0036ADAA33
MSGRRQDEYQLFDTPGPRGRRRILLATVLSAGLLAALLALALWQFERHGQLAAGQWRMFTEWPIIRFLLDGVEKTLLVTAVAAGLALPLGASVALVRLSRNRPARALARCYAELFRAVPLLLLLYAFLFGLPRAGLTFPVFWQLVIPIVLGNAAVFSEIFRAGVLALDRGQSEAAHSLGMTYWQAMAWVVIPQAVRRLVPTLVSQLVRLLKDSTLGYVVSYLELLHKAQVLGEYYHTVLPTYLVAAACFVLINTALSTLAGRLERRG